MSERVTSKSHSIIPFIYGLSAVAVLAVFSLILWAQTPLGPGKASLAVLESNDAVTVTHRDGWTEFAPAAGSPVAGTADIGFVFYPGGRVDWRSYAPVLARIAARGYLVIVKPVRLNLAFLDIDAAEEPIAAHPEIRAWAVGGHSLGGVAAAMFAEKNPELIAGIVFWASYPSGAGLLVSEPGRQDSGTGYEQKSGPGFRVLSISASNDGLATPLKIDASRAKLPADTIYTVIQGGNHGGFGDYGPQKGDNPAAITAEEQWRQTAEATALFLGALH